MDDKDDFNNNEDEKIEVVVGDTSDLAFSEVGDYMGDLKPKDVKGSKKNIIIPTNKKNVTEPSDSDESNSTPTENNNTIDENNNNKTNNNNNEDNKE